MKAKHLLLISAVSAVAALPGRSATEAEADLRAKWENGGRAETLDWFRREMYGYAPGRPADEKFDDEGVSFAGGAVKIRVHCVLPKGACAENPAPAFILIDHYNGAERADGLWHRPGTPTNSIVSRGYAYVNFNVNDVALNCYDDRWSNKVHRIYGAGRPDSWGTISAWAWGVSRVMDWIEQKPEIDVTRVGVIGHSRGGKTALWAAAQDERIALAIPNGSGTGGARYLDIDLPKAEPLDWMLDHSIKFWFCPNLQKYKGRARELPHDADDLIRLVCPRLVYVGSGSGDDWAGPQGEFEAARRASDLWRAYGLKGLSFDRFPSPGSWSNEGRVGYMLHDGPHQLTAWNWERVLDFADIHMKKNGEIGPAGNRDDQFRLFWGVENGIYPAIRDTGFNTVVAGALSKETLDSVRKDGCGWVKALSVAGRADLRRKYPRYERSGKKDERTVDFTEPGAIDDARAMVTGLVAAAAREPACIGVQPASELRLFTHPSFTPRHAEAWRAYSGRDVPADAVGRAAPNWTKVKGLPADRLISRGDCGVYDFYRWFWTVDDGFGPYFDMVVDEAERAFGRDVFTFYDPCIRCPPAWGSGGKVSHLNEWQTTQPDPFQHSYIVSKQQAMARGRLGQRVMTMVQGIFSRYDSSPQSRAAAPGCEIPAWAKERPNGSHVTPPSDMMREAFWSVFTRQLDGICVHGWNCVFDGVPFGKPKDAKGYQYTDPTTAPMIAKLFHEVAIPLGPLFKAAPERPPEVAVLETLPSAILSGRAPYDWKQFSKTLNEGIVAVAANLAPYTLYDEEILRDGIPETLRVVLAPAAQVLDRAVAERLAEFRRRGGVILARGDHAPGLAVDGELPPTRFDERPGHLYGYDSHTNVNYSAELHDADLRLAARELKAALAPYMAPYADTDNQHILASARKAGAADLLVVYNTKRTYGDYMGPWKAVLDKGVPNSGTATVHRAAGAVYDLVKHASVPFTPDPRGLWTKVPVAYETTDGNAFLVCDAPLGRLVVRTEPNHDGMLVKVVSPDPGVLRPFAVTVGDARPFYAVVKDGFWSRTFPAGDLSKVEVLDLATGEKSSVAPADALHARAIDLMARVDGATAPGDESARSFALSAWRGERVHAQAVVWSASDQQELSVAAGPFASESGAKLPEKAFSARYLRTVPAILRASKPDAARVGDCLDPAARAWPAEGYRVVWLTFDVPADAAPGRYAGEVKVAGATGEAAFSVTLDVRPRALPPPAERKFFLDLWTHPWSVAAQFGDKPFSKRHYDHLRPLYRELAAAGQKVILTTIVDLPWGEGYNDGAGAIRGMVDYTYGRDGRYKADFTKFDEYVEFAKSCGLGPQIHCYTIVKFNSKHIFYYTDAASGERRAVELVEGTPAYEKFLEPLLRQLEAHLVAKGWVDDAYIGIDEVPPERLVKPREFLKRVAPRLKFALASNVDPMRYRAIEKDVDVFSQILWKGGHGIESIFGPEYEAFMDARRKAGQITTFYVCTEPQKPNTWLCSPLAESEWIGLYAAAKRYDGFLRWACVLWPQDAYDFTRRGITSMPAGERMLLYPGGLASPRWEILRDGIEDWEKIRLLREEGDLAPGLEKALAALDWSRLQSETESETRAGVAAVLDALDKASAAPAR